MCPLRRQIIQTGSRDKTSIFITERSHIYPSYLNHAQNGNKEYLKYEQELHCETLSESSIVKEFGQQTERKKNEKINLGN